MALEGSLSDFGLADILQLIHFQRKTGILTLEGNRDKVTLTFLEGSVAGAESRRRVDDGRLGKILVRKGLITEADLQTALDEQRKSRSKLGVILIKLGLVSHNVIAELLNSQITDTVIQLFGWKQGTYAFSAQSITQDKDFPVMLDTQHLLMEGLRVVDELSGSHEKISLDAVFGQSTADAGQLSKEEAEIYRLVDGESDVSTVIDLAGRDSFEVSHILISLRERGYIKAVTAQPVITAPAPAARIPGPLRGYLSIMALVLSLVLATGTLLLGRDSSMGTFKAAGRIDGLRMGIEMYKTKHDAYPPTLDEISKEPDPWGRPFIYRPADASYTLLSSGPDGKEGTADDIN